MSEFDPKEISELDKLRIASGDKGELPPLTPAERTTFEIDLEAFEKGVTPQEILAERLKQAFQGETDE
jgi:hypothetical protein